MKKNIYKEKKSIKLMQKKIKKINQLKKMCVYSNIINWDKDL